MTMPDTETLALRRDGGWLHVTLNRPARRNAMSSQMVEELMAVFAEVEADLSVRAVVLRGAGGHFCAGGDVADMGAAVQAPPAEGPDPLAVMNRSFGHALAQVDACRAAVIAVCEGAVMGGGFGLACVADVTIAVEGARFRLPETSLGITPAQIAPFIVLRLGLSQARRLAVTGETLSAGEATRLGLAHLHCEDAAAADAQLAKVLGKIRRCEPGANAATKALVRRVGARELSDVLDAAALEFAALARRDEARAGMMAFMSRTAAPWDQDSEA